MTIDTDEQETPWPADTVATLEEADPKWRDVYEPSENGFTLRPTVKARMDGYKQQEAEEAERHRTKLAAIDAECIELAAKTAKMKEALREQMATSAIGDALRQGGCKSGLIKGAVAILLNELPVSLAEHDDQTSVVLDGGWTIETAVGAWLTSDKGRAFLEPVQTVGVFGAAIRRLH